MKKIKYFRLGVQCIVWLLVLMFVAACFWRYWAVSGVIRVSQDFRSDTTPFTTVFTPKAFVSNRLQDLQTKQRFIRLSGTPVTTQVRVPRAFDSVEATVRFVNTEERLVEFGVVNLLNPLITHMQPLEIALEQEAMQAGWSQVDSTNHEWTVYRRSGSTEPIDSIQQLVASTGNERTAVYSGLNIRPHTTIEGYAPSRNNQSFDLQLQGAHEFATYIEDEPLSVAFHIVDANAISGADAGTLTVKNQSGQVVYEQRFEDDDNISADRRASEERVITGAVEGLPAGVYTVTLGVSPDMLVTRIATTQRFFVASGRIQIPEKELWNTAVPGRAWSSQVLVTLAPALQFETKEVADTPVAVVEGATVVQALPGKRSLWRAQNPSIQKVYTAQTRSERAVVVFANAPIAWSADAVFDPSAGMRTIDEHMQLQDIDVLIVPKQEPLIANQYEKTRTVRLPLQNIIGDHKTPSFVVQVPGLLYSAHTVDIQHIQYRFERKPLWVRISDRLK